MKHKFKLGDKVKFYHDGKRDTGIICAIPKENVAVKNYCIDLDTASGHRGYLDSTGYVRHYEFIEPRRRTRVSTYNMWWVPENKLELAEAKIIEDD